MNQVERRSSARRKSCESIVRVPLGASAGQLGDPARRPARRRPGRGPPDPSVLPTCGRCQPDRPPAVVLREAVVRIGDRDEVGHRRSPAARPRRPSRPPARRRVVEGRRDPAVPERTLPGGRPIARFVDTASAARRRRPGCACRRRGRSAFPASASRARTSARRPLRAQRLRVPVVRHLPRHDAAEIAIERQPVDDHQLAARRGARSARRGRRRRRACSGDAPGS